MFAEYQRVLVPGTGTTNQLALLVQYDLNQQAEDHQLYLIGGPILSIDTNATPGDGFGAEAGLGFSLRTRHIPIFIDATLAALTQPDGGAVHAGFHAGVVW